LNLRVAERAFSPKCPGTRVAKVAPGASLCFEIVLKVLGPGAVASGAALTDVTLTDEFPFTPVQAGIIATVGAGAAKCSATANSAGGDTVTCSIPSIAENKDAIVTLTSAVPANATSGTHYKNTVSVQAANMATAGSHLKAVAIVTVGSAAPTTTTT
jgi:hypothetical protein